MIDPTERESLSNCNSGEAFKDNNNPFAPSAVDNTHNSLSSTDTEPSSDPENLNIRPVQLQYTSQLKTQLTGTPASKVRLVLEYMNMLGLNLPLFLNYLSWGDYNCITDPKIRYERTALMVSDELPVILDAGTNHPGPRALVMHVQLGERMYSRCLPSHVLGKLLKEN
ncbi:hypothetical protein SERLA73DRAFT_74323 [Serpula lacrymans var. lacrymans S7.3]|uniref:Uncharacterized protein n=1 Tax=Serpula lacrymans var. lacrymans (strain S7.3) TaxID=936435 RepID=F8Q195_SERL3|nr:hypothetical protein SERLA73DRAFT_74323 [Serpula lacrymans var. lacrymans S7.3]